VAETGKEAKVFQEPIVVRGGFEFEPSMGVGMFE